MDGVTETCGSDPALRFCILERGIAVTAQGSPNAATASDSARKRQIPAIFSRHQATPDTCIARAVENEPLLRCIQHANAQLQAMTNQMVAASHPLYFYKSSLVLQSESI